MKRHTVRLECHLVRLRCLIAVAIWPPLELVIGIPQRNMHVGEEAMVVFESVIGTMEVH
jgi:hypothetical protein